MPDLRTIIKSALSKLMLPPCRIARAARRYVPLGEIIPLEAPRILIVASHWIGDTLWAAQVVPHLRKKWPGAYICAVTKPFSLPIWTGRLAADEIIESSAVTSDRRREQVNRKALHKLAAELASRRWDLVIDLTGNRYSAMLCHWIKAKHTLGFDGGELGGLYAARVADARRSETHLSRQPLRVIFPLVGKCEDDGKIIPPEPQVSYAQALEQFGLNNEKPLAVIAPGAGWPEKRWGVENFTKAANRLLDDGWQIVLTGSPGERELSQEIFSGIEAEFYSFVHTVHEGSPAAIFAILSGSAAFLGNDSGLGHIAAAMGISTAVVFTGQTNPDVCGPIGENVLCVDAAAGDDYNIEAICRFFGLQ